MLTITITTTNKPNNKKHENTNGYNKRLIIYYRGRYKNK